MTGPDVIAALDLPAGARVDRRVPKKLLIENGASTPADKRLIQSGMDELVWLAALKPTTVAVPEHRDPSREYLEIAVLAANLRAGAKAGRLVALVHRAVPYPVVLLTNGERASISLAHKRWSQAEADKTVIDGAVLTVELAGAQPHTTAFRQALALGRQPRASLYALYQGWIDTALALEAARRTGSFEMPATPEQAAARMAALEQCARLEVEVVRLRAAAAREKQLPRQVVLNLQLKRVEAARAAACARL